MYADILELDLLSDSGDECASCCSSTDRESMCSLSSDCLSVDVDAEPADETELINPVTGSVYPIMLTSPVDATLRFDMASAGVGTAGSFVTPSLPCSANPSPVHKKSRYAIWA
jgi:hypothetical protein